MTATEPLHEPVLPPQTEAQKAVVNVAVSVDSQIVYYGLVKMLERVQIVDHTAPWSGTTNRADILVIGYGTNDELCAVSEIAAMAHGTDTKVLLLLLKGSVTEVVDEIATVPADGFLTEENLTVDVLANALCGVRAGELPIPGSLVNRLLHTVRSGPEVNKSNVKLTARERQTLELLVAGLGNKQIARRLQISIHGVKRLVANVFAKLDCNNRTEAAAVAVRDKLL